MPAPVPRPIPADGQDARSFAREALDYGDANAAGLIAGRENYQAVADRYAVPPE